MLAERNVRTGFVEQGEVDLIVAELPPEIQPIAKVGYIAGWRVGELRSRELRHVDMANGWLRLEPGETKNNEGRAFPFDIFPKLRQVIQQQAERKREIESETGRVVRSLFFWSDGRPIKDFRGSWKSATKAAGFEGLLFHDLRRSAVRNLVRAGVPEKVAMTLTGHKTRSVFERYNIVDEGDLRDGVEQLADYLRQQRKTGKKVAGRIG